MDRRDVLLHAGAAALLWPLTLHAQQEKTPPRIGFLGVLPVPPSAKVDPRYLGFQNGLRELGYVEGKNIALEWRSAEGDYRRLQGLASELVAMRVEVIVAASPPCIQAAQR